MNSYSPFDKSLDQLLATDLAVLKTVSEGWYVEYKSALIEPRAIAKSIAAFANTYGGWIFFGIQEESKENPVAGSFPGIDSPSLNGAVQKIRQAANDHINPTPHFEIKIIDEKCEEICLEVGRAIICVWIPQSKSAPHVHKRGVIYRRVADASEPIPETDRFVLDQLWHRADEIKERHKRWYDADPEFSENERTRPYLRLMFESDPWDQRDIWIDKNLAAVREAFEAEVGADGPDIPFDSVYSSTEGVIARQLSGNDTSELGITWRLNRKLRSDVIIPLNVYAPGNLSLLKIDFDGYQDTQRFIDVLSKHNNTLIKVVDLNILLTLLMGIARIQDRICNLAEWKESYFFKVKILHAWRVIPFIDTLSVIENFEKHGPSMCLDSTSSYPPSSPGPNSYIQIDTPKNAETLTQKTFYQAALMFGPIALAFGIPIIWDQDDLAIMPGYHDELFEAGARALEVQRRRAGRSAS